MICSHCSSDRRVIKYGIKPGKHHLSQRYFCYNCRRLTYTPLAGKSSNIDDDTLKQQTYQPEQQQQQQYRRKQKTETQLMKQLTGAAFSASKKRKGKRNY